MNMEDREVVFRSINSFLGTLVHNKSFNIRRDLFFKEKYLSYGVFDAYDVPYYSEDAAYLSGFLMRQLVEEIGEPCR